MKAKPIKLLVVDDEEIICNYIKRRFSRKGLDVFFALSGEDALVKFEEQRPEIVIMDIMMSGIDGVETTRRIKEKYSFPKIIIVSAVDTKDKMSELKAFGVSDYLIKPIILKELDNLVMHYVAMLR